MKTTTAVQSGTRVAARTTRWDRPVLVRVVASAALVATATYLLWRVLDTGAGVSLALFAPLLFAETVGFVRLGLETRLTWFVPATQRRPITEATSVDIIVSTFHEPEQVVRATLLGCRAVAYPHGTWLVDDAGRAEIEALAVEFGCHYLHRTDRTGARSGALNYAMSRSQADLALLLDADQVPLPDALHATVGYFSDNTVAIVQTPLDYQNRDSILHTRDELHERSLDNEVYGPARDHLGAATWNGSASVVRKVAMASVIEPNHNDSHVASAGDLRTSIRLQTGGWKIRYHSEAVVQGLAPHNLALYFSQRERWARGQLSVLVTRENPLVARGLNRNQRLAYSHMYMQYFQALADAAMFVVLTASLWTGKPLLVAAPLELLVIWGPAFALRSMAWTALSRGRVGYREAAARRMLNLEIYLKAMFAAAVGSKRRFLPVPRTGVDEGGIGVIDKLRLLTAMTLVLEIALGLRMLDALIGWPLEPMRGLALVATCAAATATLWLSLQVLGVFIRRRQFRRHFRVDVKLGGYANGSLVKLRDLTPAGVGLVSSTVLHPGTAVVIHVRVPDARGGANDLELKAITRNVLANQHGTRYRIGCRFVGLSVDQLNIITEYASVVRPYQQLRG